MIATLALLFHEGQPLELPALDYTDAIVFLDIIQATYEKLVSFVLLSNFLCATYSDTRGPRIELKLFQIYLERHEEPIELCLHSITSLKKKNLVSEKEFNAVIWTIKTIRSYFRGIRLTIHYNQASLRRLKEILELSGRLMRCPKRLNELAFDVQNEKDILHTQVMRCKTCVN